MTFGPGCRHRVATGSPGGRSVSLRPLQRWACWSRSGPAQCGAEVAFDPCGHAPPRCSAGWQCSLCGRALASGRLGRRRCRVPLLRVAGARSLEAEPASRAVLTRLLGLSRWARGPLDDRWCGGVVGSGCGCGASTLFCVPDAGACRPLHWSAGLVLSRAVSSSACYPRPPPWRRPSGGEERWASFGAPRLLAPAFAREDVCCLRSVPSARRDASLRLRAPSPDPTARSTAACHRCRSP